MKTKRRIKAMCRRLKLTPDKADAQLALKILEWVMQQEDEVKFEEIMPGYFEPQPKVSKELFMHDVDQKVWAMEDPTKDNSYYISKTLPKYTPKVWWQKMLLDDLSACEMSFGDDFIQIQDLYEEDQISWVEIETVFKLYPTWFATRDDVRLYLENFFDVDYSDLVLMSREEREEIKEREGCGNRWLQRTLRDNYQLERIYLYKVQGEEIWALRKIK